MTFAKEITNIIKEYNWGTYIETGLASGASAEKALNLNFKKVVSIEINKDFVSKAKIKFHNYIKNERLVLLEGDSSVLLDYAMRKYTDVSVIFLDAHDGDHENNAPLERELEIIKKYFNNQLIIIDDFLKIKYNYKFKDPKYWVKKNSHKEILKKLREISNDMDEFFWGKYGSYTSALINKKIHRPIINLKEIEIKLYFFLYPFGLSLKKVFLKFLKLIIGNKNYSIIQKKFNNILFNLRKTN